MTTSVEPTDRPIVVASLNIHGMKQDWRERAPLVLAELARLEPDVLLIQEAARWAPQARWLAWRLSRMTLGRHYRAVSNRKRGWRGLIEGLATITRLPIRDRAMLDLGGDGRIAQRLTLATAGGGTFDVYNLHLANRDEDGPLRMAQVRRLAAWIEPRRGFPAIAGGDFNTPPGSEPLPAVPGGFRSAHLAAHGAEPPFTSPADSRPGEGRVIDFIFVGGGLPVVGCETAFGPVERDGRLVFPSDHLGLVCRVSPER